MKRYFFQLVPSVCHVSSTQMAFIECLLCEQGPWHWKRGHESTEADAGPALRELAFWWQRRTDHQASNLLSQIQGSVWGKEGLTSPPWKKSIISGVHDGALIFLEVCLLTHESRTAVPVRDRGSSPDWPGTSWKVLVPSCPSPQRVVPSLVLTPRVWLCSSTPQKWRGQGGTYIPSCHRVREKEP